MESSVVSNPRKRAKKAFLLEKENIKQVILSKEEKAMDGAPEGDLVHVTVLPHSELRELLRPAERAELIVSMFKDYKSKQWSELYGAVDSLRQLSCFHSTLYDASQWFDRITFLNFHLWF